MCNPHHVLKNSVTYCHMQVLRPSEYKRKGTEQTVSISFDWPSSVGTFQINIWATWCNTVRSHVHQPQSGAGISLPLLVSRIVLVLHLPCTSDNDTVTTFRAKSTSVAARSFLTSPMRGRGYSSHSVCVCVCYHYIWRYAYSTGPTKVPKESTRHKDQK